MGVNGLHASIKHALVRCHISSLKGQRAACDASAWMVRGGATHARDLYTQEGYTGTPWTEYTVEMAQLLLDHGVVPVMVFDGRRHPLKKETSVSRHEHKESARREALIAEEMGDVDRAKSKWMQAFSMTGEMAAHTWASLEEMGVECIQAEQEADQTMAALAVTGQVHIVISEDSDMVAYKCPRILFKLRHDGEGDLLDITSGMTCQTGERPPKPKRRQVTVNIHALSSTQVAMLCVLSGCDYISNIARGWGIKRVYSVIINCSSLDEAIHAFQKSGVEVSDTYIARAQKCMKVFLHPSYFMDSRISRVWVLH